MAFNMMAKNKTEAPPKKEDKSVPFEELPIVCEKISVDDGDCTGYNFALYGQETSGKTTNACTLGYCNLEFAEDFKTLYPTVIWGLENGYLPNVERIIVIETENILKKQLRRGTERKMFESIHDRFEFYRIPIPSRNDIVKEDMSVILDPRTVKAIEQTFDLIFRTVDKIVAESGPETLIIIDSGSDIDALFNAKTKIIFSKRTARETSDKVKETISQSHWQWRNDWWDDLLTRLRGCEGFVVTTFKEQETPEQWQKPGELPYKIKWPKRTAFKMDQVYRFLKNPDKTLDVIVDDRSRYMVRGVLNSSKFNRFHIDMENSKFGFFPILEGLMKIIKGDDVDT